MFFSTFLFYFFHFYLDINLIIPKILFKLFTNTVEILLIYMQCKLRFNDKQIAFFKNWLLKTYDIRKLCNYLALLLLFTIFLWLYHFIYVCIFNVHNYIRLFHQRFAFFVLTPWDFKKIKMPFDSIQLNLIFTVEIYFATPHCCY